MIIANDTKTLTAASYPVYDMRYTKFIQGVYERMGDDARSDLGISIEVLLKNLSYLNKWLVEATYALTKKRAVDLFSPGSRF